MKTTWLIGWGCKYSNVLSWPILINRGLNHEYYEKRESSKFKKRERYIYVFLSVLESTQNISGDNDLEATPVPIPNTEVKL